MYVKLGDKDVEYNKNFKLFLHTKLSNPHYPPEIQAETTLINFTVTEQVRCLRFRSICCTCQRP
jgi:dynein heavy chain